MKFSFILFSALFGYLSSANAIESFSLKFVQSVVIDTKVKFEKTKLGGFSGLVIKGNDFYVITDDRGRYGEPRIYKFAVTSKSSKDGSTEFSLALKEKILLLKKTKKMKIYDFEAFVPFRDGWIVSTEGDWSSKPKELADVFFILGQNVKQTIPIPEEFKPQFQGKQISGLYNNKAFEGMCIDQATQHLYLLSESGLSQKSDGDSIFYLIDYKIDGEKFSQSKTWRLDFKKHLEVGNLYNGATDLIKLSDDSFLILTRSVQAALSLQYSNLVWLIQRKAGASEWEVKSRFQISGTTDLNAIEKGLPVTEELNQNYEGMAVWEQGGKKYLVLVSDDNFNSFEKSVFSFFELEVK